MKIIALVMSFLAIIHAIATGAQVSNVTQSQAIYFVMSRILANDSGKVDIFISKDPIASTTGVEIHRGRIPCPFTSNWVVFVDDHVFAYWAHPCRYIFVNTENQEFETIIATMPPEDVEAFRVVCLAKRPPEQMAKSVTSSQSLFTASPPNPHLFAVIISGGYDDAHNPKSFWNDISAMYATLTQVYGFPPDNIYVHSTDGTLTHNHNSLDLDGNDTQDIKHAASVASIDSTFQILANTIVPSDNLFIYVTDHGDADQNGSFIYLWGSEILRPSNLSAMLAPINASEVMVLLQQCKSGGFITDAINITGPHRIIQTECSATEWGSIEENITQGNYTEFSFYWTAAARGYYPDITGAAPWTSSAAVGSFDFSHICCNHPADYNPDLNSDGVTTLQEVFQYANNFDSYSPYGYYYAYGPEDPQAFNNICFQVSQISLNEFPCTISPTLACPHNSDSVGTSPTLSWNALSGATSYALQVASDSLFSNLSVNVAGLTSLTYNLSGLSVNSTYYWHVNASDTEGTSVWSSFASFKTAPPRAPYLSGSTGWFSQSTHETGNSVKELNNHPMSGIPPSPVLTWTSSGPCGGVTYGLYRYVCTQRHGCPDTVGSCMYSGTDTSYIDTTWVVGFDTSKTAHYYVKATAGGQSSFSNRIYYGWGGISPEKSGLTGHLEIPKEYSLLQAYPNPFNPTATIEYQLPANSTVSLKIYNLLGQVVQVLKDDIEEAGYKEVQWNASNVGSGVYLYIMESSFITDPSKTFREVRKMVLIK